MLYCCSAFSLQRFDAVGWVIGEASACKKLGLGFCWWWHFEWRFARLIAPVVTTTSIILSFNKIQNGDILIPVNPAPPEKWPLKHRECCCWVWITAMVAVLSVLWEFWLALWTYDLRLLQGIPERTLLLDGLRILAAPWGIEKTTGTTPDHTAEHICWHRQTSQLDTNWSNGYGLESAALVALCTLDGASQKWRWRQPNLFRAGVGMDAFGWTGFNSYWDRKSQFLVASQTTSSCGCSHVREVPKGQKPRSRVSKVSWMHVFLQSCCNLLTFTRWYNPKLPTCQRLTFDLFGTESIPDRGTWVYQSWWPWVHSFWT